MILRVNLKKHRYDNLKENFNFIQIINKVVIFFYNLYYCLHHLYHQTRENHNKTNNTIKVLKNTDQKFFLRSVLKLETDVKLA